MQQAAVQTIIYQIVTLMLLGLTGFISGRTGYLPDKTGVVLSRVVIKLTAPILIITKMADYDFTRKTMIDGISIYLWGFCFLFAAYCIGWVFSRLFKLPVKTDNIYVMQSMFGNVIYLAYPLLDALFKEEGIIYAVFFNLANDTLLWTLGIYLVNRHSNKEWKHNLKHMINGNTIAFSLGVLFMLTNFKALINTSSPLVRETYYLLFNTFSPLGKTTVYLSMLFIGLILSEIRISSISDLIKRYPIFVMSFFKLLFVPLAALFVLNALGDMVDPFVKTIVVLQLAMPCATIVPALAAQYDSDYRFATEGVFISTILGILTLPLVYSFI